MTQQAATAPEAATTATVTTIPAELTIAEQTIAIEERKFALAQRQAKVYADSQLVPQHYRGNIGNVLIAQNMAKRMGADLLMVMQNLYVVHGNPGWSSQFLIGTFNSNGRFSAIKYRFKGDADHKEDWGCQAYCTELSTGEEISGTWVTWNMANAEGWVTKNGSKWKTMAEQMFRYRSATFLIRSTAPEIAMGLLTKEELEDMGNESNGSLASKTRDNLAALREQFTPQQVVDHPEGVAAAVPVPVDVEESGYVDGEVLEPPTADEPETEPDELDELESLRADVQARYDELSKSQQKDLIAGKNPIGKANQEELIALLAAMEAM